MDNPSNSISESIPDSANNPGSVYRSSTVHNPDSIQQIGNCLRQEYQHLLGTDLADGLLPQGLSAADFRTWRSLEQTIHEALQIIAELIALERQLTSGFFPVEVADQTQTFLTFRDSEQSSDRNGPRGGKQLNPAIVHPSFGQLDSFSLTSSPSNFAQGRSHPVSLSPLFYGASEFDQPNSSGSVHELACYESISDASIRELNSQASNADRSASQEPTLSHRSTLSPALSPPNPVSSQLPTLTRQQLRSQHSEHQLEFHDSGQEFVSSNRPSSADRSPFASSHPAAMEGADFSSVQNSPRLRKSGDIPISASRPTASNPNLGNNLQSRPQVSAPRVVTGLRAVAEALETSPLHLRTEESYHSRLFTDYDSTGDLSIASVDVAEPPPLTQSATPSLPTSLNHEKLHSQYSEHWSEFDDLDLEANSSTSHSITAHRFPFVNNNHPAAMEGADFPSAQNPPRLRKSGDIPISASQAAVPNPSLENNLPARSYLPTDHSIDHSIDYSSTAPSGTAARTPLARLAAADLTPLAPPHTSFNRGQSHSLYPTTWPAFPQKSEQKTNSPNHQLVNSRDALAENEWLPLPDAVDPTSPQPSWNQLPDARSSAFGQTIATPSPIRAVSLETSQLSATQQWQEDSPTALELPAGRHADLDLDRVLDAISREIAREYRSFYGD